MRALACWAAVLTLGLGASARGEPAAREKDAGNYHDAVVFTDSRPVVFRLRVEVEGQPLQARWEEYLSGYFKFLDRNGDGELDKGEVARLPDARALRYQVRGLVAYFGNPANRPALADLDANRDGKVKPDELMAYFRAQGAGPFQVTAAYTVRSGLSSDALSEAIFARLDADKDGALSEAEAGKAGRALALLDENDDEILTAAEIQGTPAGYAVQPLSTPLVAGGEQVFVLDRSARTPLKQGFALADAALARYDRDKDRKLSRAEMELSGPVFAGLDTNKDGKLDRLELIRLSRLGVDAEAVVRLGNGAKGEPVEVLRPRKGVVKVDAKALRQPRAIQAGAMRGLQDVPASVAVMLEGMRFQVIRAAGQPSVATTYATYFKQLMRRVDSKGLGYLTRKQVEPAQYRALQTLFDLADCDGDDKLTAKEVTAYLEMNSKATGATVTLSFETTGRGLFEMLDGDGDGRLSVRELRSVWSRLRGNDRDGDSKVTRQELPREYQFAVSRGASVYRQRGGMIASRPTRGVRAREAEKGPVWFRKMDRNHDGDVSRREFLGPREVFARIDADGDGLIDAEEAEKADAVMRAGK
jgi:Ca2+-binding EF-hand superfamily protein